MKKILLVLPLLFLSLFFAGSVFGQEVQKSLDQVIADNSLKAVGVSSLIIAVVVVLTFIVKNESSFLKKVFFLSIILPTIATTGYLIFSTISLNVTSQSGGPVHWHADFQIYNCGERVDLKNPTGFSNKIGTSVLHEHNDERVHLEGVVLEADDASLGKFFKVIGGELTDRVLAVPTDKGILRMESGKSCANGDYAQVQVFVYKTADKFFSQEKLTDPAGYKISPFSAVPPGDCVIFEYGTPKEETDYLCRQYKVKEDLGEIYAR